MTNRGFFVSLMWPLPPRLGKSGMPAIKLEMGWPLIPDDVLGIDDRDHRSRALKALGYERLVREEGAEVIDRAGEHELLRVRDMVFVCMRAASRPRRYLLEVPPTMRTVRQAISWSFGR